MEFTPDIVYEDNHLLVVIKPHNIAVQEDESKDDDLLNLFVEQKERNIIVHSSGIKYSPALAKAINVGCANVVLSFDSGCRETYKKIKTTFAFWINFAIFIFINKFFL